MKVYGVIPSVNLRPEQINQLAQVVPIGRRGEHYFRCRLAVDDSRLDEILGILHTMQRRPWTDRSRPLDDRYEFHYHQEREYELDDLEDAPFLEFDRRIEANVHDTPRRADGLLRFIQGYLNESLDFAFSDPPTALIVPDRVKRLIEHSALVGVKIRQTLLMPGTYADADAQPVPWETHGPPWWELDSDFTMPPLSDSMTFTDSSGRVLTARDFSNGFHRREGLYLHPELHYRASDLENVEPFDLARTFEPFGNRKGYNRLDCPLIASNRFYRFCVENGLKTGWVPVRIDP